MAPQVDARGLSCPLPVILTKKAMAQAGAQEMEVLVDTDTARENVTRLAAHEGWSIEVLEDPNGYRLILKKG